MTPNEFVIWFRGFSEACHHLNPTPQQWEKVLEKLNAVKEQTKTCTCSPQVYTYPYNETGIINPYVQAHQPDSNQLLND